MGTFFLHIGLPKTATTSLQRSTFPSIENVLYVGRSYLGVEKSGKLYQSITDYCFGESVNEIKRLDLSRELRNRLTHESLLLSDEWFTTDYLPPSVGYTVSWQEKTRRLSQLVKGLSCKVLVTIRSPYEGLFSQYCELLAAQSPLVHAGFLDYALNSNDSKAYRYPELAMLLRANFENVQFVSFKDVTKNDEFPDWLSTVWLGERVFGDHFTHENSKIKRGDGVEIEHVGSSVYSALVAILPVSIRERVASSRIGRVLKLAFRKSLISKEVVPYPSDESIRRVKKRYEPSIEFLNETHLWFQ